MLIYPTEVFVFCVLNSIETGLSLSVLLGKILQTMFLTSPKGFYQERFRMIW